MAINIATVKSDLEHLSVDIHLTGLNPNTHYDLLRLEMAHAGPDAHGNPIYERQIPDRRKYWSAVAHRIGWAPATANPIVHDYECPRRPTKYFIVESALVGPTDFDFTDGNYPVARGFLDNAIVDFNYDLYHYDAVPPGDLIVRSTHELGKHAVACIQDLQPLVYKARGNEFAVMGSQYPVFVSDTREAARGTVTLVCRSHDDIEQLYEIVFPSNGRIRPIIFHASDPRMLLHDIRVVPMDVSVEQATANNPDLKYVHIDYVETDPTFPLVKRSGDNDDLVQRPNADFFISDRSPRVGQHVTFTDESTGQYDSWLWHFGTHTNIHRGRAQGPGPYHVTFHRRGTHEIKLRVWGAGAGADHVTKTITVH